MKVDWFATLVLRFCKQKLAAEACFLITNLTPTATYDLIHIFGWTEYAYHAKLIENYLDSRMSEEEIDRKITVILVRSGK